MTSPAVALATAGAVLVLWIIWAMHREEIISEAFWYRIYEVAPPR
jgi:hypothetical protein